MYGFDPEKTEEDMLKRLKIGTLLHFPRPTSSVARERAARLQELIHFCATDGLSQSGRPIHFKKNNLSLIFSVSTVEIKPKVLVIKKTMCKFCF